jgi:hypothetical protein
MSRGLDLIESGLSLMEGWDCQSTRRSGRFEFGHSRRDGRGWGSGIELK